MYIRGHVGWKNKMMSIQQGNGKHRHHPANQKRDLSMIQKTRCDPSHFPTCCPKGQGSKWIRDWVQVVSQGGYQLCRASKFFGCATLKNKLWSGISHFSSSLLGVASFYCGSSLVQHPVLRTFWEKRKTGHCRCRIFESWSVVRGEDIAMRRSTEYESFLGSAILPAIKQ